jgi:hypothetical protein
MQYQALGMGNIGAYVQNRGTAFIKYHGHGKMSGHDMMSPEFYYWDDLGRRITYNAYDLRSLCRKLSGKTLRAEGIKRIMDGGTLNLKLMEKFHLKG